MKSKVYLLIGLVVGLLLVGGGIYFISSKNKKQETVSPASQEQNLPEPTTAPKLLIWNDPAGFTFQYDAGLEINNHPEDKVNYANLEITKIGEEGKILILAADTKLKTISQWQPKAVEAILGGKPAKKTATAIGAIDDQILFTIEMAATAAGQVWQSRFDQIVSSFEFVYPTSAPVKSSAPASSASEGDIIEEEEIIE